MTKPTKEPIKNLMVVAHEYMRYIDFKNEEIKYDVCIKFMKVISKNIVDWRVKNRCLYKLENIIMMALFAILMGYYNPSEMHEYCDLRADFLRKIGLLGETIPSHDTFRRILTVVESESLLKATITTLKRFYKKLEDIYICNGHYYLLSADGKEICGSGRGKDTSKPSRNVNIMNFYETSTGLVIECEVVGSKTNEIPVGQKIFQKLNLKQVVVTFDALNTQKDTLNIIVHKKGDYVATVKNNHQELLDDIKKKMGENNEKVADNNIVVLENKRFYFVPVKNRIIPLGWDSVYYYVRYEKDIFSRKTGEVIRTDTLHFVTSLKDKDTVIESVLNRWQIENVLHRGKDLLLLEDSIRCTNPNLLNNIAILNNLALAIITLAKPLLNRKTIKETRKAIMLTGENTILAVLKFIGELSLLEKFAETMKKK